MEDSDCSCHLCFRYKDHIFCNMEFESYMALQVLMMNQIYYFYIFSVKNIKNLHILWFERVGEHGDFRRETSSTIL